LIAIAQRTARIKLGGSAPKLGDRTVRVAGLSECAARERARQRRLDRASTLSAAPADAPDEVIGQGHIAPLGPA
jgi:hypothetical protein